MALIDFTLSNARRFYSSTGNPLGLKGLLEDRCTNDVTVKFFIFLLHKTNRLHVVVTGQNYF